MKAGHLPRLRPNSDSGGRSDAVGCHMDADGYGDVNVL